MVEIKFENNKSVAYEDDKKIGECDFIVLENIWNIIHTEVNSAFKGQGIAKKLVECIIENAKRFNISVIADCSYAKKIIERHQ